MRVREKLLVVFGIIQSGLALLTLFLAVVIFFNFFDVQSILAIAQEFVDFYEKLYYIFSPKIAQKMQQNAAVKNVIRWVVVSSIVYFLRRAVGLIEQKKR